MSTNASRASRRSPLRRRPFVPSTAEVTPTRRRGRQTILAPTKGYRLRILRVRVVQPETDGRHVCEIYFGEAATMVTEPSRAVDILAVPNEGTVSTRAYDRGQGPRGRRGEPLSLRWRGRPPSTEHKVIIEYTEES